MKQEINRKKFSVFTCGRTRSAIDFDMLLLTYVQVQVLANSPAVISLYSINTSPFLSTPNFSFLLSRRSASHYSSSFNSKIKFISGNRTLLVEPVTLRLAVKHTPLLSSVRILRYSNFLNASS